MSDLISRKDAIEAIANLTCFGIEEIKVLCEASMIDSEGWLGGIRDAVIEIEALPSAEPERMRGKWLEKEVFDNADCEIPEWQTEKCSVCGKYHTTPYLYNFSSFAYCPNCGSKMMRGEDGKA